MNTYTIQNEIWQAEITPAHGANIDSLLFRGKPVYRRGDWEKEPFFQGAAMLLPANRTVGGRFSFEGRNYTLPINEPEQRAHLHGTLHRQPFRVVSVEADSITMVLENRGQCWPFAFRLEVTYAAGEAFTQRYRFTALERMPFTFGLHTAFAGLPHFCAPLDACQEKDAHHLPTGRYIPLGEQERSYCTGSPSAGRVITGYFRSGGQVARVGDYRYEVSPNFDHWILFNARGERDFLCVEPQAGAVDGLNNGSCTLLEPGQSVEYQTKIST